MTQPDDFAPGGSEVVRRTKLSRPEQLPPGRRNQDADKPVNPRTGALQRIAELQEQAPAEPAARRRPSRQLAEPAPEPVEVQAQAAALAEALADTQDMAQDFYGEADPVAVAGQKLPDSEILEAMAEALMFALRLRIVGEPQAGTWEEFDELAESCLLMVAPVDPRDTADDVTRFLWGDTGFMNMPESPSSGEEIADIIRLGGVEQRRS